MVISSQSCPPQTHTPTIQNLLFSKLYTASLPDCVPYLKHSPGHCLLILGTHRSPHSDGHQQHESSPYCVQCGARRGRVPRNRGSDHLVHNTVCSRPHTHIGMLTTLQTLVHPSLLVSCPLSPCGPIRVHFGAWACMPCPPSVLAGHLQCLPFPRAPTLNWCSLGIFTKHV